jgi:putative membrane protein
MKRIFQFIGILGLSFSSLPGEAFSQGHGYGWETGPGMMGWGHGMGGFGMILIMVFGIALIIGIIILIRLVWLSAGKKGRGTSEEDNPLEILRRRYARGEVNKEEFEQKKKDLGY